MSLVETLKIIVLGIVEGFTEWLPISSTGHMILVDEIIRLDQPEAFKEMFLVVIQLGAILAVAVMYFHRLNPFSPSKNRRQREATWALWIKIIIACIPAAVLGLLLDDWMEAHLYNAYVVAAMLILYGILFIVPGKQRLYARWKCSSTGSSPRCPDPGTPVKRSLRKCLRHQPFCRSDCRCGCTFVRMGGDTWESTLFYRLEREKLYYTRGGA